MGLFSLFFGKTPEELEIIGDTFFKENNLGMAKLEYEKALSRHKDSPVRDVNFEDRIKGKIVEVKEGLAVEHIKTGKNLIDAESYEDAEELISLAMELSEDASLHDEAEELLDAIADLAVQQTDLPMTDYNPVNTPEDEKPNFYFNREEYFVALCNALPPEEKAAYMGYGEAFIDGYIALNQGDFTAAAEKLLLALEKNPDDKNHIPLELATCYLNMAEFEKARGLLESYLNDFPHSEKAYHVLSETLWHLKEFDEAASLLQSCPRELADTVMINMLKGETELRAGRFKEAEKIYLQYIDSKGKDHTIMRALAKIYELMGKPETARNIYTELMNACTGCGSRADVHLKRGFADTSFKSGVHTTQILDVYLELLQEDPGNAFSYADKISRIYAFMGNDGEARRFKSLMGSM